MSIFTQEILALAASIQSAEWGVDDDGNAFAEFEGVRETAPIERQPHEWWPVSLQRASDQAHKALEARLGRRLEYHRYHRSHPYRSGGSI